MKKVVVIGAGYVGLVTAACLAEKGNHVTVVERNPERRILLEQNKSPFYEPGLDALLLSCKEKKSLHVAATIGEALLAEQPSLIFSCVGTPSLPDGSADLSFVWDMASEIGTYLNHYAVIINKSTVPVGTTQRVKMIIHNKLHERGALVPFDCASNPEFLKEGSALADSRYPDRIILGVDSLRAEEELTSLYAPFITEENRLLVMRIASAELAKYASNAMLATRISFMNQTAQLAEKVGADIQEVREGMALDKRIGPAFLQAGIGYGGSCFPKDVQALVHMGKEQGSPMSLVETVDQINKQQREWFIGLILEQYGSSLAVKNIGIWGLSFKPETDDLRDAPSLDIIKALREWGARVIVYDPVALASVKMLYGDLLVYASSSEEVLELSDALIVVTEWQEFLQYKAQSFIILKDKIIFDARNCLNQQALEAVGITYRGVGKQSTKKKDERELFATTVNPARKECSL